MVPVSSSAAIAAYGMHTDARQRGSVGHSTADRLPLAFFYRSPEGNVMLVKIRASSRARSRWADHRETLVGVPPFEARPAVLRTPPPFDTQLQSTHWWWAASAVWGTATSALSRLKTQLRQSWEVVPSPAPEPRHYRDRTRSPSRERYRSSRRDRSPVNGETDHPSTGNTTLEDTAAPTTATAVEHHHHARTKSVSKARKQRIVQQAKIKAFAYLAVQHAKVKAHAYLAVGKALGFDNPDDIMAAYDDGTSSQPMFTLQLLAESYAIIQYIISVRLPEHDVGNTLFGHRETRACVDLVVSIASPLMILYTANAITASPITDLTTQGLNLSPPYWAAVVGPGPPRNRPPGLPSHCQSQSHLERQHLRSGSSCGSPADGAILEEAKAG
ncbi:hypothetical protein LTR37_001425 [Vermiconidia calcicola]|uniref:Uncharacterized protein n=1 Tax=Vermiconidia calcicola TaxID=1690605 RepID=A0ACC3NWK5_9PEZI|nr:hypothetical protein LTR37_001425 [Vermiconidia calcicola]